MLHQACTRWHSLAALAALFILFIKRWEPLERTVNGNAPTCHVIEHHAHKVAEEMALSFLHSHGGGGLILATEVAEMLHLP